MEVAEQNFKNTTAAMKVTAEFIEEYIKMLLQYLEEKDKYAPNKALAEWIKKGGALYLYNPRGGLSVLGELEYNLTKERIAFVKMNDGKILIAEKDIPRIKEINHNINVAHCNYYQSVHTSEMETCVAKYMKNKELVTIQNVDENFVTVLKNKCNDITKGFMIGTEEKNGGIDFTVLGKNVYSIDGETKDFCRAYLEANLSLYGINEEKKNDQLKSDERFDNDIRAIKDSEYTHYVIGVDEKNVKNVLEINKEGLLHKSITIKDGQAYERLIEACDKTDVNYNEVLEKCLAKIPNKSIITNEEMLNDHVQTFTRTVDSDRPYKSRDEYYASLYYDAVCDNIDSMIREKLSLMNVESMKSEDIFNMYKNEASEIMRCMAEDKIPTGYTKEKMDALKDIYETEIQSRVNQLSDADKDPVNISKSDVMEKYKYIINKMSDDRAYERTATDRTKSVVREDKYGDSNNR